MSLRPLLNTMPVIGAVRIGLWEMPDLHFEVTALGGQVALLPMLKTWLYDTVKSAVLTPYMVPGGYQLTLKEVCEEWVCEERVGWTNTYTSTCTHMYTHASHSYHTGCVCSGGVCGCTEPTGD